MISAAWVEAAPRDAVLFPLGRASRPDHYVLLLWRRRRPREERSILRGGHPTNIRKHVHVSTKSTYIRITRVTKKWSESQVPGITPRLTNWKGSRDQHTAAFRLGWKPTHPPIRPKKVLPFSPAMLKVKSLGAQWPEIACGGQVDRLKSGGCVTVVCVVGSSFQRRHWKAATTVGWVRCVSGCVPPERRSESGSGQ